MAEQTPVPIHPFPARMAPDIAVRTLDRIEGAGAVVLDPMVGSGTTIVAAKAKGHFALGFDCDPLAVLIARAWTQEFTRLRLRHAAAKALDLATDVYAGGSRCPQYPVGADAETRDFVRYWFDPINRRQLAALSRAISEERHAAIRNLLWCAFSRLIIAKERSASRARDLAHSRPHRWLVRSPLRPLREFLRAVEVVAARSPFADRKAAPEALVRFGDARRLPLEDGSVDVVITSPPYLNAIDYLRGHKFSLVWMGWSLSRLRAIRAASIGSELSIEHTPDDPIFDAGVRALGALDRLRPRFRRIAYRFIRDMQEVMRELARVVKPRGHVVLVIGESCFRGARLRNVLAVKQLAAAVGLRPQTSRTRIIPARHRYLPPPSHAPSRSLLRKRMTTETMIECIRESAYD